MYEILILCNSVLATVQVLVTDDLLFFSMLMIELEMY